MPVSPEVATQMPIFLARLWAERKSTLSPSLLEMYKNGKFRADLGKKYARIVMEETPGQASAFGFVDIVTGDIYKSASWSTPAKGVRGSIFEDKIKHYGDLYR